VHQNTALQYPQNSSNKEHIILMGVFLSVAPSSPPLLSVSRSAEAVLQLMLRPPAFKHVVRLCGGIIYQSNIYRHRTAT
jgi:hypothetical protein